MLQVLPPQSNRSFQLNNLKFDIGLHGGPTNCTTTVSQQIVLHCVPIKQLVLSDFSVAHVASHKHCVRQLIHILSVKYFMHGVILEASLRHWYNHQQRYSNSRHKL